MRTVVFVAVIVVLLAVAALASRRAGTKEGMLVGPGVSPTVNGLAITGEFASVATFLGLVGGVSLAGFSGFIPILGVPLGFLVLLVVVAGPLRAMGRYTVGDMLARRLPSAPLRVALGVTGLVISAVYMIGQFVGAASLIAGFFGFDYVLAVVIIGALTMVLVMLGGMTSATAVQFMKTVLLLAASAAILLLALSRLSWNPLDLLQESSDQYGPLATAPQHAESVPSINTFSATLATVFGIAGMPHLMIRFLTVRTEEAARRSALVAIWVMSCYLLTMGVVGYAAGLIVGRADIAAASPGGTTATIDLAQSLGGAVFAAIVAGLVFAIIAAVLAGLLVSMMGIIAHDLYAEVMSSRNPNPSRQVTVARAGAAAVAVLASGVALIARDVNLIFVGSFAFGVAASTVFPVVLLSLYWRRFTLQAALTCLGTGLASSAILLILSPSVLGADAPFPYTQPAIVTIPLAFLAAWVGTVLSSTRASAASAEHGNGVLR